MDDQIPAHPAPTSARPLLGLTVLVVEDSRFASEALRMLCLRSGARIRRADCLKSGRRHLQVYCPSVVIVDLGLPDGSGADLIAELSNATPRVDVLLGLSGDDTGQDIALAAGADGFLPKPLESIAYFQNEILKHLPADRQPTGPRKLTAEVVVPDKMAFRDDMVHLAEVMSDPQDEANLDYVAQFLIGVARSAHDSDLTDAAGALATARREGRATRSDVARIAGLVQERLAAPSVI